jgi:tRNA U34 5-methylaminomethyl-2-thiouridine-forming methyltransferase MnmC
MESNYEITRITTEDGSHSLYIPDLRETYHSTRGALQESIHVFIRQGLENLSKDQDINVLEIGLGTGLNVLLTAHWAEKNQRNVSLTSIEAYPLDKKLWQSLNYAELIDHKDAGEWWLSIHDSPWETPVLIHPYLNLRKHHTKLEDFEPAPASFDIIFYDAFAPSKQAEMWSKKMLEKIVSCMKNGALIVTYCAQGQFKRTLNELGVEVQTLDGPPGKKEMVRGIKRKD